MRVCTVLARNYLAQARVLVASIAEHHPGISVDVVVIDVLQGDPTWVRDDRVDVEVLGLAELGIPDDEWRQMRAFYDVYELATSVKPAVLRRARALDPTGVVAYLDPDMVVFAPLEGLDALAADGHGLVLTPHVRAPIPRDGLLVDEPTLLQSGAFNLGFVAVGPGSEGFLEWWDERLRTDAVVDRLAGLFTDQKWLDLAPALFGPTIIESAGWNVAYWNLHERPLSRDADGTWRAGGDPLRLIHWSGYDPAAPHLLARHQGPKPRVLLSDEPALAEVLASYDGALRRAGWEETHAVPYGWGELAGRRMPTWLRRVLRQAILAPGLDPPPPDPYDECEEFLTWLAEPVAASRRKRLPRLGELHWQQRDDLRTVFPDVHGADLDHYVHFLDNGGDDRFSADVGHLFDATSTSLSTAPASGRGPLAPGIVVTGYVGAALGIGTQGRTVLAAAEASGLPVAVLRDDRTEHHDVERTTPHPVPSRESLSLLTVNADALAGFLGRHGDRLPPDGRRVGVWAWEVPTFPARFHAAFALVDEVWTISSFIAAAVEPHAGDVPVRVIPYVISTDPPTPLRRRDLGIPDDRYTFGFAFDARSVVARKNPAGLVRAYSSAFGPDDGAALFVKVLNGAADVRAMEELRWLSAGRPDITLVDTVWSGSAARAFTQLIDCYVSLHRGEGFGHGMAEAMAQGRPVIATGWSGNLEFMDSDTSVLVPYDLVEVGPDREPYPADAVWAEPDLSAAAAAMRRLADSPEEGVALGATARDVVTARFPLSRTATFVREAAISAYEAASLQGVA